MDEAFCLYDACTKEGSLQGKGKKVLLNVVGKGVNHQEDAVALLSSTCSERSGNRGAWYRRTPQLVGTHSLSSYLTHQFNVKDTQTIHVWNSYIYIYTWMVWDT